ncbi:MAG: N-acetylmuramoyl-L-alanine amidase [Kofleriaceae bacterium]|nr:N-acetylmuramoyl-L-alanine amidase [Kofleriaceae bacterium]
MKLSQVLPLSALMLVAVVGCTVGSDEPLRGDEASLALHDETLATELRTSPVHHAAQEFSRIGVMIDSDSANDIEIATSNDGTTWSAWQHINVRHIEANARSAFNGEIVLNAPARHYKLRGTPANASSLRLDTMDEERNNDWEDGESTPTAAFAPAAFGNGYTYRTRAEWGAKSVNCAGSLSPKKITIHHTDTPASNPAARVRAIQEYHRNSRRWCDIGYHFLVDETGVVYEGRSIRNIGAHAGGANTGNIGIAFIGSYDAKDPTAAQMAATAKLMAELATKYNITLSRTTLKGHREVGTTATACPGARTFAKLSSLVAAANAASLGGDGGGDPEPPEPSTNRVTVTGYIYSGMNVNNRIAGATVAIGTKSTITGSDGSFSLTDIEARVQTVSVSKTGYIDALISRNVSGSAWVSTGLSERSTPSNPTTGDAGLQGVIYRSGDSSDRIPYATISVSNGRTATADANGFYSISNIAAGAVTITASAPNFTTSSISRTLNAGETEWGSIPMQP